jgi:hypothetical protein
MEQKKLMVSLKQLLLVLKTMLLVVLVKQHMLLFLVQPISSLMLVQVSILAGLTGIYRTIIKAKARALDDMGGLTVICSEKALENYKRTFQANERYMVMDNNDTLMVQI